MLMNEEKDLWRQHLIKKFNEFLENPEFFLDKS